MEGGPLTMLRINSRDGGKERGRLVQIMTLPLLKVNYLLLRTVASIRNLLTARDTSNK